MTTGVGVLCLCMYSAIKLWQVQVIGGWQTNGCWTWDVGDVTGCECALFPTSAGYIDYVMVFNL